MRTCLINDCTGFVGIAPCCLDCSERDVCPDRCHKTNTMYCVGVIEENDCKRVSETAEESRS